MLSPHSSIYFIGHTTEQERTATITLDHYTPKAWKKALVSMWAFIMLFAVIGALGGVLAWFDGTESEHALLVSLVSVGILLLCIAIGVLVYRFNNTRRRANNLNGNRNRIATIDDYSFRVAFIISYDDIDGKDREQIKHLLHQQSNPVRKLKYLYDEYFELTAKHDLMLHDPDISFAKVTELQTQVEIFHTLVYRDAMELVEAVRRSKRTAKEIADTNADTILECGQRMIDRRKDTPPPQK